MINSRAATKLQSKPASIRSRCLHLLHQMYTKHPLLEHLERIRRKEIPSATDLTLQLYDAEQRQLRTVTFDEALLLIKPLSHLSPRDKGGYAIKPLKPPTSTEPHPKEWELGGRKNKAFARAGRSKDMPLMTVVTPSRLVQVLSAAYENLVRGARLEFRIGQRNRPSDRSKTVDWALTNALHLRPDVIMRAMPEGTQFCAQPCYENGVEQVVMWGIECERELRRAKAPITSTQRKQVGLWNDPADVRRLMKEKPR